MQKGKRSLVFIVWILLAVSGGMVSLNGCGGHSSGAGPAMLQVDTHSESGQAAALDAAPENLDLSQAPAGRTGASVWGGCPGNPPPPGAWSADSGAASETLAFDGDHSTAWIGANQKEWDIYFGAGSNPASPAMELDFLHVNFFSDAYTPATTQLYISNDPCSGWTNVGTLVTGGDTSNPYIDLGAATMTNYIWIHMEDSATKTISIRDVDWEPVNLNVGSHAWPSHDADVYYPSKALDGDYTSTYSWVGKVNAGAWSFYYDFGAPRDLDMVTAHLFNINYHPTTMTLYTSDTGTNGSWTQVGKMGPLAKAAQYVGDNVRYVRIDMSGNPPSTFPYITEITWDFPLGASSGDSYSSFYNPDKAFDGQMNTWWVGDNTQSHWELFYRYPVAQNINDITINWYATSHMPQTTTLYCYDGSSWSNEGTFPMSATALKSVNASCEILRFSMDGTGSYPAVGYPLIKDISIGGWLQLGSSATGNGVSGDSSWSYYPDMAVDSNGYPIITWSGNYGTHSDDLDIYLKRWNGTSWVGIGGSDQLGGISDDRTSVSSSLALDSSNNPAVAYAHWNLNTNGNYIYFQYWTGSAWAELGGSASNEGLSDTIHAEQPDVVLDSSGYPIVTWTDSSINTGDIYVKRWNGSAWVEMNNSASGGGISGTGGCGNPVITLDGSGYPVVAWQYNNNPGDIYVKRWNGSAWVEMDGSATGEGISDHDRSAGGPNITIDNSGYPVVVWTQGVSDTNSEIYLKRWNGSSWIAVGGSSSSGGISNSNEIDNFPSVAANSSGDLYVAYYVMYYNDWEIYVKKWNGSSWVEIDGSATSGGVSDNSYPYSEWPSIAVDNNGYPMVAWEDDEIYFKRWLP